MVSYQEAFKRPFSDVKNAIIGVVLGILPIVNFLVMGYALECARTAMKKKFKLPEWTGWGKLFVNGLLYIIIVIIYFIPLFLVASIFIGTAFFEIATDPAALDLGGGIAFGMFLAAVVFLLTIYVLPAAALQFAQRFTFADAFAFKEVFQKTFTAEYFKVWVVMMLYYAVLGIILSKLGFIGMGFLIFITEVTMMTAFGEVYPTL